MHRHQPLLTSIVSGSFTLAFKRPAALRRRGADGRLQAAVREPPRLKQLVRDLEELSLAVVEADPRWQR